MKYIKFAVLSMALSSMIAVAQQAQKKVQPIKKAEASLEAIKTKASPSEKSFTPVFYSPSGAISEYEKNDVVKIYKWVISLIDSVPGKPDKFSTSDEKRTYEAALQDRFRGLGQIPVVAKCRKKYDGDLQRYEVSPSAFSIKRHDLVKEIDAPSWNIKTLTLLTDNIKHDTYTGQNAYGAETTIKRSTSDIYVLAFPLAKSPNEAMVTGSQFTNTTPKYELDWKTIKFSVSMAPNEARTNDENIACLYVFTVEAPYHFRFNDRENPTRDMPFDISLDYYAVYGSLDIVAVINKADGKLYSQAERKP